MVPAEPRSIAPFGRPVIRPPFRFDRRLLILLAVCLLINLAIALLSSKGIVQDDAISYCSLGEHLAHGDGYVFAPGQTPTAWRAPGYPVFLATVFRLTGGSLVAARIGNAFLSVGTTLCVAAVSSLLMDADTALLAAALVGFYPELLGLSGLLWSESLSVFLFSASGLCVTIVAKYRLWAAAVLAGVLTGACILTRSTFIVMPVIIALCGLTGLLKRSQALTVCILACAVVAPWTLRNYKLIGSFVFVESNATMNLYAGNRPYAPIPFTFRVLKMLPDDPQYQAIESLPINARYAAFGAAAKQEMLANPKHFALLAVSKTIDFWLPDFFVARNVASGSYGQRYEKFWILALVVTSSFYVVITSLAVQMICRYRAGRGVQMAGLLLALYTLPHSVVFGASRFHIPVVPVLCICAAPELLRQCRRVAPWVVRRSRGEALSSV